MRAEYLAAYLAGSAPSPDNVGHSTKPYDEKAAYLARVSQPAMAYAEVVYFGRRTEESLRRVYTNVLTNAMRWWRPIGDAPEGDAAQARWKSRNMNLIEKMTWMALAEMIDSSISSPNRAKWRAEQVGITERRWFQAYRERYDRITAILNDWDGEFRGKVHVNQRELRVEE